MTVEIKLNNVQKDGLPFETINSLRPYLANNPAGDECVVIKVTTHYGKDPACLYLKDGDTPMWCSSPSDLKIIRPLTPDESITIYGHDLTN